MYIKSKLFTNTKRMLERSHCYRKCNHSVLTINHERRGKDLDTDRSIA